MDLHDLRTPDGEAALAAATDLAGGDPLAAAAALRSAGVPPDLAAAALTQATLRRQAVAKFGASASGMFFTRAGLEQATRSVVARRRSARLVAAGVRSLADLGCGIGADSLAAARAGLRVVGVELDPATAAVAAANGAGLFSVVQGDATTFDVSGFDAVFCDPARRSSGGRRVFDPSAYSPSWDFVSGLAARFPRVAVKVAPGFDHARVPAGAETELVSVDRDVVEATLWCGALAEVPRRATVLRAGVAHSLTGSGLSAAPVGPVGGYLYDPDGAVVRAGLVAEFASTVGGRLGDPTIAYVWADAPVPTSLGRCFAVTDVVPFSLKRLRTLLRSRDVGTVEILKRGSALDPAQFRRDLRLAGQASISLLLTRVAGAPVAVLATPITFEGGQESAGNPGDGGADPREGPVHDASV
ncbi:Methyltransferase domain-containing protein [Asanoa hainanensis]|uniref:Methyltransferase domain-containing protein n=1 Tax=Asanoa hainanensis TaxID=560556 RepID=A0A239I4N7_9ACTN|nr:class I SAM-dependent methyltransferase [Asanoa hainanensis]SNS87284.1 Methyltransferase domain-containing protein [Asanoa hainanensis]